MTNEEAINILIAVAVCSTEYLYCDEHCPFYHPEGVRVCNEWNDEMAKEAVETISALRQQEHFRDLTKKVEPLTLDELSKRNAPVFLPIKDFPNGGYWCLCENGYIIPPSGYGFMAKERPNWVFYSQKPEEDDNEV